MDNQKPQSHVRLALSMVLVVVIAAGLIGAAYLRTNSTPSSTSSATSQSTLIRSPAPCVTSYPQSAVNRTTLSNGTQVTHVTSPALVMSPGSTMSVCVYYGGSSGASYSIPASSSVSVWGPGGQQLQPAQNLNVTASPALISIPSGQSTVIEYTVTAGQGSTGFYSLSTAEACVPVPVAVGDEPSRVNASDFPGPSVPTSVRVRGCTRQSSAIQGPASPT